MRTPFSPNAVPVSERVAESSRRFRPEKQPAPRSPSPGAEASEILAKVEWARERGLAIDLEIGCGVGWHPIRYSAENRDRLLFAVEQTAEKFGKFHERLARHGVRENLVAVHADAVAWLVHTASAIEFDRILIFYPNPNPKNPAARWIRMPFFGYLLERLAARGTIHFRTNSADYADEVRRVAASRWGLDMVHSRELTREMGAKPTTHFERKYLERGEICREIVLAKRGTTCSG